MNQKANLFPTVVGEISELIKKWEEKFLTIPHNVLSERKNKQNRSIKQIVGHMIDSASNNIHRIVHLQYGEIPLKFPNYATNGNNDRWIGIQNYQDADWNNLVMLWKSLNLHYIHVVNNVNVMKLDNQWYANEQTLVSLRDMIIDYLRHFKLHISEIEELLSGSPQPGVTR